VTKPNTNQASDELADLIERYCRGELSQLEVDQLQSVLKSDSEAREIYRRQVSLYAAIRDQNWATGELPALPLDPPAAKPFSPSTTHSQPWKSNFGSAYLIGLAALLMLACTAVYFSWFNPTPIDPNLVAERLKDADKAADAAALPEDYLQHIEAAASETAQNFVGNVVNISDDVVWGSSTKVNDFLFRVSPGNQLNLESGLIQIDYFSGASIILRGPARFDVIVRVIWRVAN
jgi:hypothetical protein